VTNSNSIRAGSTDDLDAMVEFRLEMFREMGWTDESRLTELAPRYRDYLKQRLAAGDAVFWVAADDGRVIGAVALLWEQVPPTVRNLTGRRAYVFGLYVRSGHRRRGIAKQLAQTAIGFARDSGAEVVALHSSEEGKGLYRRLGFVDSPEMRLFTEPSSAAWSPVERPAREQESS
jgi:ribosomal protein S18 acetylase RimI-like enzyme